MLPVKHEKLPINVQQCLVKGIWQNSFYNRFSISYCSSILLPYSCLFNVFHICLIIFSLPPSFSRLLSLLLSPPSLTLQLTHSYFSFSLSHANFLSLSLSFSHTLTQSLSLYLSPFFLLNYHNLPLCASLFLSIPLSLPHSPDLWKFSVSA